MSTNSRIPPARRGLGAAGKALHRAVYTYLTAENLELDPVEGHALLAACHQADVVSRMEEAMAGEPLTVRGSQGQQVAHPLLVEARQGRAEVARLLARLKISTDPDEESATRRGRYAANVRWRGAG